MANHEVARIFSKFPRDFMIETFAGEIRTLGEVRTDLDGRKNIIWPSMSESKDITKKYLVWYFKGSEVEVVLTDSCHGTNIRTEVRVTFNHKCLGNDVFVDVNEANHIVTV